MRRSADSWGVESSLVVEGTVMRRGTSGVVWKDMSRGWGGGWVDGGGVVGHLRVGNLFGVALWLSWLVCGSDGHRYKCGWNFFR